jgi:hypothetical protein
VATVVVKEIQDKMKNARSKRKKQLICEKLIRNYKLMGLAKSLHISYKRLRPNEIFGNNLAFTRKTKKN